MTRLIEGFSLGGDWVGNTIEPGSNARLRLHSVDLKICETCTIQLHDETSGKDVVASVKKRSRPVMKAS